VIKSDVIVIGGGPGGYLAAERLGEAGKAVTLIEELNLGGVCLNEGCIPSKTYLNSAKLYNIAKDSKAYGVTTTAAELNHQKVLERKNNVVKTLVGGVAATLKGCGVKIVSGRGILKERTPEGIVVAVGGESYLGEKVIIATGSSPIIPNIPGLKDGVKSGYVITNREIFELSEIPANLVIIGGGVVGLEMAHTSLRREVRLQ
jgi:dihydrolipoamide dehydrogenase